MRSWIRDRALGLCFIALFLSSWLAQLYFEWKVYAGEELQHDESPVFWSANFWETFWQSTLENWQSEFLQVAAFTIVTAYLVYKGSSESPDGEERLEVKLDALLEAQGLDPQKIEGTLPAKYQKTR